jgi:hypothetical protein
MVFVLPATVPGEVDADGDTALLVAVPEGWVPLVAEVAGDCGPVVEVARGPVGPGRLPPPVVVQDAVATAAAARTTSRRRAGIR